MSMPEEKLSTADMVSAGQGAATEPREGATNVRRMDPSARAEAGAGTAEAGRPAALLAESEAADLHRRWDRIQTGFVDDPRGSIADGDRLVRELMETRGYPVGDFEQRVADISVDHPRVVEHYRAAHGIAEASAGEGAGTEDLRQAMVHYRALFEDLLEVRDEAPRRMEAGR